MLLQHVGNVYQLMYDCAVFTFDIVRAWSMLGILYVYMYMYIKPDWFLHIFTTGETYSRTLSEAL